MATKWGIVGAGKISNDFVAALRTLDGKEHEIVAVAARELNSAQKFASNHNIPKAYGSYAELANDTDVEITYIGVINTHHYPLGKLMLECGKHVLLEKPMTLSAKQTRTLGEISRRNKRFLMEALWSRSLPSYKHLISLIRNGTIGEVVHIDATFGIPILNTERIVKRNMGGGTILDLGIYPLNIVSMVYNMEKPIQIAAVGHLNDDGIDTVMTCSLKYSNNRTACVTTSGIVELSNDVVITGTKGIIKVPDLMYVATKIETPDGNYEFPIPDPDPAVPVNYPNSTGLKYEAMEVRKSLKNGELESLVMPVKDSVLLAELMDEIRRQIGVVYPDEENI